MPYVRVNNRHRGDDGKVRGPGDVVYVSSVEADKRTRDGQVRAAKPDEMPKPKVAAKAPAPDAETESAPKPPTVKTAAPKPREQEKKPSEGK